MGFVGLLGLAAGSVLLIYVPTLSAISRSLLLFGGFHILGLIVLGLSAYLAWGRSPDAAQASRRLAWLNGATVATLIAVAAAIVLQVTKPDLWILSFLVVAQGVSFFAGSIVIRDMHSAEVAALPLVDLRIEAGDRILDLGCGSGRSTLALARGLPARIDALDQFTGRAPGCARLSSPASTTSSSVIASTYCQRLSIRLLRPTPPMLQLQASMSLTIAGGRARPHCGRYDGF